MGSGFWGAYIHGFDTELATSLFKMNQLEQHVDIMRTCISDRNILCRPLLPFSLGSGKTGTPPQSGAQVVDEPTSETVVGMMFRALSFRGQGCSCDFCDACGRMGTRVSSAVSSSSCLEGTATVGTPEVASQPKQH